MMVGEERVKAADEPPAGEMLTVSGKAFRGTTDELRGLIEDPRTVEFRGCSFVGCDLSGGRAGAARRFVGCTFDDSIVHLAGDYSLVRDCSFPGLGSRRPPRTPRSRCSGCGAGFTRGRSRGDDAHQEGSR